jgi:hypothetical protein
VSWSGSTAGCRAGAPSGAAQAAIRQAVNYYRAMAGLPAVNLDATLSTQAQQAALMMTANQALSHDPPSSWSCWTQSGHDAAGRSNLALGFPGARAIAAYMADAGTTNAGVGHRRWLLNPRATVFGSGATNDANALLVVDAPSLGTRPTRPPWVAWPSAGYFPAQVEPGGRWSLAANDDTTDFSAATVSVTDDGGNPLPVTVQPLEAGYADPTLVWQVTLDHGASDPDATFHVHVEGIVRNGQPTTADYDVTLFDADVAPVVPSRFVPVPPARLFDTRTTQAQPLAPMQRVDVTVLGAAGVPASGVTAVTLNLTATQTSGPGYVTAWPAGRPQPTASNLNVNGAGNTVAAQVTVGVGVGGKVSFVAQPRAHLLADVSGYFVAADQATDGRFVPVTPARLFDSRPNDKLAAGTSRDVTVAGAGGVPATGAAAAVLTVTATQTTDAGFVTAWPTGTDRPDASSLNAFAAGQTVPNLVTVPLGAGGAVSFYSQRGTHLVVDVVGYFTDPSAAELSTGLFVPLVPARMLDTRDPGPPDALGPGGALVTPILGAGTVPATGVGAVLMNVTATRALGAGFVTVWPSGQARPTASTLNLEYRGQTRANAAIVAPGTQGRATFFTQTGADLVVDVAGYFLG